MAESELAQRFQELSEGLVAPLILGGKIHLRRPFGRLALRVGDGRRLVDDDLRSRVDVARVRRARLLSPVDTLPDIDAAEWGIAAALNDLLQVSNHELGGVFTRGRYERLLASVQEVCSRIPAPRDVGAALARHATFARVMELVRTDTFVTWWTGSASYRGAPPPKRLLYWQGVRRVRVDTSRVALSTMCDGMPAPVVDGFVATIGRWLSLTPLTDLASVTRSAPAFTWSAPTLALVATRPGRTLAFRALSRQPSSAVREALLRAASALPRELAMHKPLIEDFVSEVVEGLATLKGEPNARAGG